MLRSGCHRKEFLENSFDKSPPPGALHPLLPSYMKKLLLTATILACSIGASLAGDGKSFKETKVVIDPDTCRFRDTEFQVDAFYTGFFGGRNTYFGTGSGGGIGLNFFFAKYFGIGYEGSVYSNNGTAQWLPISGNFFIRYPICSWNLAPYVMVGGGGTWDGHGTGFGNVGGGLEYRFTDNIGIFTDARYYYGGTGNVANLRSGLRIAF